MNARRRRWVGAVLGTAVLVGTVGQVWITSAQAAGAGRARAAATAGSTATTAASGWKLAWSDDFTGTVGTSPSSAKWVFDTGGEPQWGNEEWQYYTKRTSNVSLDGNGHLAITARKEKLPGMSGCEYGTCDITSGRITTKGKFAQKYGRIEARLKIPAGKGLWPAFWMLGANDDRVDWPNCGELDIMEAIGSNTRQVEGTAWGAHYPQDGLGGTGTVASGSLSSDYHLYAIEWSSTEITWFLDGTAYYTLQRKNLPSKATWPFDQPFYLILNLAVGGTMPGSPNASTPFPSTLLVDYVRTYTKA